MNIGTIVKTSFFISLALTCVIISQKINYAHESDRWLESAIIASLVFMAAAIYEVRTSKIRSSEKTMWTITLFFSGIFAGLIYMLFARKRIIKTADARSYHKNSSSV